MKTVLGLALLAAALAAAVPCAEAVVRVPTDYDTIQLGIDAAAPGEVVLVEPGIYSGDGNHDIDFAGANVFLLSEAGPSQTIIDCGGGGRGFYFHSGEPLSCTIDGFTIRGGSAARGGGMRCEAGSSVTVRHCVFRNNEGGYGGGGISLAGASALVLEYSTIEANSALRGGGIMAIEGSTLTISHVSFLNNTASLSAGLRCEGSPATLTDVLFEGNLAYETVGGFACFDGDYMLTYVTFRSNSATTCGGFGGASSSATLTNCTFALNAATQGAAINCGEDTEFLVTNTIISLQMAGTPVFCDATSTFDITKSCIYGNAGGDALCGNVYDNMFVDPLFCDVWGGDLRVHWSSPCLPDNNAWAELVGAHGGGCTGPSPVETQSWGQIKGLYR